MTTHQHDAAHPLAPQRAEPLPTEPDDLTLARAIAQAIQRVPGVQGLSAGRFGTVATYGRGGRVPGVVFHWNASSLVGMEVHLVASEIALRAALYESVSTSTPVTVEAPFLLGLAEQVRAAILATGMSQGLLSVARLDVSIDDLG